MQHPSDHTDDSFHSLIVWSSRPSFDRGSIPHHLAVISLQLNSDVIYGHLFVSLYGILLGPSPIHRGACRAVHKRFWGFSSPLLDPDEILAVLFGFIPGQRRRVPYEILSYPRFRRPSPVCRRILGNVPISSGRVKVGTTSRRALACGFWWNSSPPYR